MLDLTTKTWSLGTNEPNGRFGHTVTVGPNNKIYSIGGSDAGPDNTSKVVEVFTP
jgi:N-acetylneuraminic acid mutarotase